MNRPAEIQKLMNREEPTNVFVNMAMSLMSNLNMSFEEVKNLPFPIALAFLKKIKEARKK